MRKAWGAVCNELGLDIHFDRYAERIGLAFHEILEQVGVPDDLHERTKQIYDRESFKYIDNVKLFDYVIPALQRLKDHGFKVTLATSKTKDRTDAILECHFHSFKFDYVTTPESVARGRGKPKPDQLLRAAIEVGADPYNSLYVGDMEVDRQAAKRAGFQYIYAKWGYGDLTVHNDVWFHSINDLVDFLTE
jgi:phosphoglycolate phosphatase-like HAD superfamily hydrolase